MPLALTKMGASTGYFFYMGRASLRKYRRASYATILLTLTITALVNGQDYLAPADYYKGTAELSGEGLKSKLHEIASDYIYITYSQVTEAIRLVDQDPQNSSNIIEIYTGNSTAYNLNSWNREHIWPQSFGAQEPTAPHSDLHHLFPANGSVNSARSNFTFTELPNGAVVPGAPLCRYSAATREFEPGDLDKGRIARALFYLDMRYDGLGGEIGDFVLTDYPNQYSQRMGKISDLLIWNRKFAPDERERRRNHLIFTGGKIGIKNYPRQANRNPFVDHPEWVDAVFTSGQYVTRGSWRAKHFDHQQLLDELVSGDLADPDFDGVENLIEMATNTDPWDPDTGSAPRLVRTGDGSCYLEFHRLKAYAQSGLNYLVEYAYDPLQTDGWLPLPYSDQDLQKAEETWTEYVTLGDFIIPERINPVWMRLKVVRDWPIASPGAAIDEPFRRSNFWQESSWLGTYADVLFPHIFSPQHHWITLAYHDGQNAVLNLSNGAWLMTSPELFPYGFDPLKGQWVMLSQGSLIPLSMP